MLQSRRLGRSLFLLLLVAACGALAVAPLLQPARAAPPPAPPNHIVISEFSTRGDAGLTDEFIELHNPTSAAITIQAGWQLMKSDCSGTTANIYTFPADKILASGQHYLLGGQSYNGSVTADVPNLSMSLPDQLGIALVNGSNMIDQVATCSGAVYHEGNPLQPMTGAANQSYDRFKDATGACKDTASNVADFLLRTPSDPQRSSSPLKKCGNPTISGRITIGSLGIPDVTVKYKVNSVVKTVLSDSEGYYMVAVPSNWSGVVSVSKTGFFFGVKSKQYLHLLGDETGEDYISSSSGTPVPSYLNVVINEIGWSGTTYTYGDQWIELYNTTNRSINLKDWKLIGTSGTIGTGGVLTLGNYTIPANGYFIIAKRSDVFQAASTGFGLPTNVKVQVDEHLNLSSYGEPLSLDSNTGALIDTANHLYGRWPAGSFSPHASMERHSTGPDTPTNWYTFAATSGFTIVKDRGGYVVQGTPGRKNWAYTVIATPSPVPTKYKTPTSPPPTPFAHMVINEFLPRAGTDWNQDRAVDVFDEFIEIKNLGPIDGDLSGWRLDNISSGGTSTYSLPSTKVKSGERVVLYGKTTHIALYDSGGTVRLTNTRGVIIDARSYGPVNNPDQTHCRLPDGYYWRFPCFPTPGNENSLTGVPPAPPPSGPSEPPCLMPDIVPAAFRDAECHGFGADIFNPSFWDDQSGFREFLVLDLINKARAIVK